MTVKVDVQRPSAEEYAFSGELQIRQTDYAIEPESVAGVVSLADAVTIRFRIAARLPGRAP